MHYYIAYDLSALLFLAIIEGQFFIKPRFPNQQNRLFGIILVCATADLVLDLLSAKAIEYAQTVPIRLNLLVIHGHLFFHILFPAFFVIYAFTLLGRFEPKKHSTMLLLMPTVICEAALLTNPFTRIFFYFDANMQYVMGPWHDLLNLERLFYVVATTVVLSRRRKEFSGNQLRNILGSLLLFAVAIPVQYMYPQYLIIGMSTVAAINLIFSTLQNPDHMLDLMSGVFNYNALLLFLEDRFYQKKDFQIIVLELCDLRQITDLFGIHAENEAVISVGRYLMTQRDKPWVFRMVSTRYAVITETEEQYQHMLHTLEARFEQPWQLGELNVTLQLKARHLSSVMFLNSPGDVVTVLDAALSEPERANQRNSCIVEIDEAFLVGIRRRLTVESAIRQALDTGKGLETYIQPIFSLEKQRFSLAEVLLRLQHPSLGMIPPSEFIPIAEKSGLAAKIDEWVIRHVCKYVQRNWASLHSYLDSMELNLSAAGILQQNFAEKLMQITGNYNIDPSFLVFEITETAATNAHHLISDAMRELHGHGFRFALDDYGTGYANITQVVNLPFHIIKLDRSLLVPKHGEENTMLVFEDTLRMFRRMGKTTVVEGVETEEEIERVRALQADYIQGYIYARPVPEEEFLSYLSNREAGKEDLQPMV